MDFVSWDGDIPDIWKNKTCSKPPTIYICIYIYSLSYILSTIILRFWFILLYITHSVHTIMYSLFWEIHILCSFTKLSFWIFITSVWERKKGSDSVHWTGKFPDFFGWSSKASVPVQDWGLELNMAKNDKTCRIYRWFLGPTPLLDELATSLCFGLNFLDLLMKRVGN